MGSFINVCIIIFFCVCVKGQLHPAKYDESTQPTIDFFELRLGESQKCNGNLSQLDCIRAYTKIYTNKLKLQRKANLEVLYKYLLNPPSDWTYGEIFRAIRSEILLAEQKQLDTFAAQPITENDRRDASKYIKELNKFLEERIANAYQSKNKDPYEAVKQNLDYVIKGFLSPKRELLQLLFEYLKGTKTASIPISVPELVKSIKQEILNTEEENAKIPRTITQPDRELAMEDIIKLHKFVENKIEDVTQRSNLQIPYEALKQNLEYLIKRLQSPRRENLQLLFEYLKGTKTPSIYVNVPELVVSIQEEIIGAEKLETEAYYFEPFFEPKSGKWVNRRMNAK